VIPVRQEIDPTICFKIGGQNKQSTLADAETICS
jgi:hypothetical protein